MKLCEDSKAIRLGSDGRWHHLEECDDGNTRSGDGCSSECTIEPGYGADGHRLSPPRMLQASAAHRCSPSVLRCALRALIEG
jgi:cysteine-rich repeat protein